MNSIGNLERVRVYLYGKQNVFKKNGDLSILVLAMKVVTRKAKKTVLWKAVSVFALILSTRCSIFGPETETTSFSIKNECDSSIVLKSSAIIRYSDGPKNEYREYTIGPGEQLLLRSLGTTSDVKITEVFTIFEIFLSDKQSSCSWSKNGDWEVSKSGKKAYTYHVPQVCFE